MNKTKEKEISSIKSEISEITNFAEFNIQDKIKNVSDKKVNDLKQNETDTVILTRIVKYGQENDRNPSNIKDIKEELKSVRLVLLKQEKVLAKILLRLM